MKILYLPNRYSQQRQREKPVWIYPVLMAMEAQYYRNQGHDVRWYPDCKFPVNRFCEGVVYDKVIREPEGIDFLSLPIPDRCFTDAFNQRYQVYGNYKYHPATHIQVANGCWHGKCTFCVENKNEYKIRDFYDVIKEISDCHKLGFKEIFDDSGTFPIGDWLHRFYRAKNAWRDTKDIVMGCNMRITRNVDFDLMKASGFRMVLFGIESANQRTLDKIKKGIQADDIIPVLKKASEAGLEPHGAFMFGYPWESEKEERETLKLCHFLLRKGYLKTAQASTYTIEGYAPKRTAYAKRIYEVGRNPEFWFRKLSEIHAMPDLLYVIKGIKKGMFND